MKTKHNITGEWFGETLTIPKGTRCTNMAAGNEKLVEGHFFVDDLSWVPLGEGGIKKHGFIHDATYYGIPLTSKDVTV